MAPSVSCVLALFAAAPLATAIKSPNGHNGRPVKPKPFMPDAYFEPKFGVITIDSQDGLHQNMAEGLLLGPKTVPWLEELREVKMSEDGMKATEMHTHPNATVMYFGLRGRCQLDLELKHNATARATNGHENVIVLPGPKKTLAMRRGRAITVFPGVASRVGLLEREEDRAAIGGSAKNCVVLRAVVASGHYVWPKQHGFEMSDYNELPQEFVHPVTRKDKGTISKRVFLQHRRIPGVYQLSISQLEGGAKTLRHKHETATEIFINYDGWGCALTTYNKDGRVDTEIAMNKGKVVIVPPGKEVVSHNTHDRGGCWNLNLLIGDPIENRDLKKWQVTQEQKKRR